MRACVRARARVCVCVGGGAIVIALALFSHLCIDEKVDESSVTNDQQARPV